MFGTRVAGELALALIKVVRLTDLVRLVSNVRVADDCLARLKGLQDTSGSLYRGSWFGELQLHLFVRLDPCCLTMQVGNQPAASLRWKMLMTNMFV